MNGGDTNLGGPQVTPNSPTPPTPGSQPASSASSTSSDSSPIISIPHPDKAPSKPLVIKVQTPTPQPSTPPSAPSSTPSPSLSSSAPAAPAPRAPTPTIATSPQPSAPTLARPSTISTETFSTPASSTTGAYYGTNASMPAQNYPSGYTNSATSPTMQTYASQYPTSTDTYAQDDQQFIELAGSTPQPKNSKKWWVIGGAIGLIVAGAIVGVAAWVFNAKTNNNKLSFYGEMGQFLCYLIDECKEDIYLNSYNPDEIYSIDTFYQDIDNKKSHEYFIALDNYWEDFLSTKNDEEKNKELYSSISDDLKTLRLYSKKPLVSEEEIIKKYKELGSNAVNNILLANYPLDQSSISDGSLYLVSLEEAYISNTIDLLDIYNLNGCLTEEKVNVSCVQKNNIQDTDQKNKIQASIDEIKDYTEKVKNDLKILCKELIGDSV